MLPSALDYHLNSQANAQVTSSTVHVRMMSYLHFFKLEDLCTKLQSNGIFNLDYCSSVWYNSRGDMSPAETQALQEQKTALRK